MKQRFLAITLAAFLVAAPAAASDDVSVFAASSLASVLEEIFQTAPQGISVRTSFAGTSTVARQIEAGAPVDIFISANETWVDYLENKSLLEPGSRRQIAANHLVLVSPKTSQLPQYSPYHLMQLKAVRRIAIGETSSVPAGIYGREVLVKLGLWDALKPKLLPADSVRSALSWVERGEADLGFVYRSDAMGSNKVSIRSIFRASDKTGLTPIYYTSALVAGHDNADVRDLYAHLFSPEAKRAFTKHGFQNTP